MTGITKRRFERKNPAPVVKPQAPAFRFPDGGPYPMRLAVGIAKTYETYTVELMVGGFATEDAARKWAQVLQAMMEKYAGANTGPTPTVTN